MRLRLAAVVAAAVAASVLAVPAAAVEWVEERAYIPTKHGEMYVDFVRPKTGKAPVLLTITPLRYVYGNTDATESRTDYYRERYTRQGYARAYADLLGTGLSGGCWDYGGQAEAAAGAAVVEWLGTRPWSTGKVGMIGLAYEGSIQLEVAALAPKHLAAIVPQEAVSSWYDYNYENAVTQTFTDEEDVRETEYPVGAPDYSDVLGAAPSTDTDHSPLPEQLTREAGCDTVEHETRGRYGRPEYDTFWRQRDWSARARNVRAAVLFQHGWRDMNTKPSQFTRYWQNLTNAVERRALLGQWGYADVFLPQAGEVPSPISPLAYLDAFLARHLKGSRERALDRVPAVLTQANDGKFRATLPLTAPRTAFRLDEPMAGGNGTFTNTGTETSKLFKSDPAAQRGFASYAFPVTKDTRLTGSGEATLRLTSTLPRGQAVVTLLDVGPESTAATVVTLGMLDLRYRDSRTVAKDVPVTRAFTVTVPLRPQDYVLKKGHRLVVAVAGSDVVWGLPDLLTGQNVAVLPGSVLRLPLGSAGATVG